MGLVDISATVITERRAMALRRKARRQDRRARKQGLTPWEYLLKNLLRTGSVTFGAKAKIDPKGWVMSEGTNA